MDFDPTTGLTTTSALVQHRDCTFITTDPAQADLNTYRYCGNMPTEATDPGGLFAAPQQSPDLRWVERVQPGTAPSLPPSPSYNISVLQTLTVAKGAKGGFTAVQGDQTWQTNDVRTWVLTYGEGYYKWEGQPFPTPTETRRLDVNDIAAGKKTPDQFTDKVGDTISTKDGRQVVFVIENSKKNLGLRPYVFNPNVTLIRLLAGSSFLRQPTPSGHLHRKCRDRF